MVRSWCLYDWANSAFATTILAAVFPPYYRSLALEAGASPAAATSRWAFTTVAAVLLVALLGPLLGAAADRAGARKRMLAGFAALGILATAGLALPVGWAGASVLFILANLGFSGSLLFYEALLPAIARPGELDRVSARGYAVGYVGGGLLLALNALWLARPGWFGFAGQAAAARGCFVSVALWWALFMIPLLRNVPEPPGDGRRLGPGAALGAALARLGATARSLGTRRQLFLFLLAFWLYGEGINTIIKMASAYGDELGIGRGDLVGALLLTQAVGVPCALGFGRLAGRIGAKRAVLLGIAAYTLIAAGGFFLRTTAHFYLLALAVGMVQGGTQALSRSLFAAMVPRRREAEFFGFFAVSARFSGILGPLLFGLIAGGAGTSRLGILSTVFFFAAGGLLLMRVDERAGARAASGPGPEERTPEP